MAIRGLLEEELGNSLRMIKVFRLELQKLLKQKDSVLVKEIKGHRYLYKAHRENERVVYQYLGKYNDEVYQEYVKRRELKKKYRNNISIVSAQIKALRSALRGPASI